MQTLGADIPFDTDIADATGIAPRRPWIAGLISVVAPGLGHVYAGAPLRGVAAFVLFQAVGLGALVVTSLLPGQDQLLGLALAIDAGITANLVTAWDAVRVARRRGAAYRRRWYNRWYLYLGLYLFSVFVIEPAMIHQFDGRVFEPYRLPSDAMAPALRDGDFIFVAELHTPAVRGEVVTYTTVSGTFVKRIVGQPGDTLVMRGGQLIVNGRALAEPYAVRADSDRVAPEFDWQRSALVAGSDTLHYKPSLQRWGPLVVPPGKYFVLGDNRGDSYDSRYMGFVSRSAIVGHVTAIYFSRDPETHAIRWERIGRAVQ